MDVLRVVLVFVRAMFRRQAALAAENLALRHQLRMLPRSDKRPKFRPSDRLFWVVFSRLWNGWRPTLHIAQPATVVKWHRQGFSVLVLEVQTCEAGTT